MKVIMILVAALGLGWSLTARGEETEKTDGHRHQSKAPVKLEQACGSCHSGTSFVVTDSEFHNTHPWTLLTAQVAENAQAQQPAETTKTAFLGVGVEKPSETLRAQLGLQEGMGLVVNFVEENSPAKGAGIRQHDVLQKLDDQWLVNEEQLVTLVRLKKPGDAAAVEIIRAGKARNVTVRLGEKQVAAAPNLSDMRTYIEMMGSGTLLLGGPTTQPTQLRDLTVSYDSALAAYTTILDRSISVGPITVDDGSHVIIYTPKDGGVLVAMEKDSGTILFNGPVATDEQWQAVPTGVKEKMQELHESFRRGKEGAAQRK
jgi:hypothetical protein